MMFLIVIGCTGFFSSSCVSSFSASTHRFLNSGRYFSTGSSTFTLPSSTSIIKAAAVIGFDCEAIQNIESGCIGFFASTSEYPAQLTARIAFDDATSVTAPASEWLSTNGCNATAIFPDGSAARVTVAMQKRADDSA